MANSLIPQNWCKYVLNLRSSEKSLWASWLHHWHMPTNAKSLRSLRKHSNPTVPTVSTPFMEKPWESVGSSEELQETCHLNKMHAKNLEKRNIRLIPCVSTKPRKNHEIRWFPAIPVQKFKNFGKTMKSRKNLKNIKKSAKVGGGQQKTGKSGEKHQKMQNS